MSEIEGNPLEFQETVQFKAPEQEREVEEAEAIERKSAEGYLQAFQNNAVEAFCSSLTDEEKNMLSGDVSMIRIQKLLGWINDKDINTSNELSHIIDCYVMKPRSVLYQEDIDELRGFLSRYPSDRVEELLNKWIEPFEDDQLKLTGAFRYIEYFDDPNAPSRDERHSIFYGWVRDEKVKLLNSVKNRLGIENDEAIQPLFEFKRKLTEISAQHVKIVQHLDSIIENSTDTITPESLKDNDILSIFSRREDAIKAIAVGMDFNNDAYVTKDLPLSIGEILTRPSFDTNNLSEKINPQSPFDEQQLAYAGLILSPKFSDREFYQKLRTAILEKIPAADSGGRFCLDFTLQGVNLLNLRKLVDNGEFNSWDGVKVMEIGGSSGAQALERMGAVLIKHADAGHGGYSISYNAGLRGEMIEISNYRGYAEPHSVDCIISSRLFDTGSGIGEIAEPSSHGQNIDVLGEHEMNLVMNNLLCDNGWMMHYDDGLPWGVNYKDGDPKLYETLGDTEVYNCGTHIYRYHQDKITAPKETSVGRKVVVYNQETQTWERPK